MRKRQANAENAVREAEHDLTRASSRVGVQRAGGPLSLPGPEARALQSEGCGRSSRSPSATARARHLRQRSGALRRGEPQCDFLSLNEYAGWYYDVGKPLDQIRASLERLRRREADDDLKCGADPSPLPHGRAGLWSESSRWS